MDYLDYHQHPFNSDPQATNDKRACYTWDQEPWPHLCLLVLQHPADCGQLELVWEKIDLQLALAIE